MDFARCDGGGLVSGIRDSDNVRHLVDIDELYPRLEVLVILSDEHGVWCAGEVDGHVLVALLESSTRMPQTAVLHAPWTDGTPESRVPTGHLPRYVGLDVGQPGGENTEKPIERADYEVKEKRIECRYLQVYLQAEKPIPGSAGMCLCG